MLMGIHYHFPPDNCDARRMQCGKLAWPMLSHNSQLSDGKGQKPKGRKNLGPSNRAPRKTYTNLEHKRNPNY